ncbi:MAG: DUF4065 domain-containing protein [Bacteroidota bacterium]|nr:DUF4065 domain-containing protein [Bacteroidota bacterium]MXW15820.1 DUF4065 domain-containing protein [Rhodothermaceae bacterium]MDE2645639.1 DUF4065 domain-containing protein [Bacteroidota bacterium]MXW32164.1 DUF4065 domain-containing protein [Rhodothermaceae bacterium]MXZ18307.1 DUF4065 domain-containing protein [Rhodothermaceae bacterium]
MPQLLPVPAMIIAEYILNRRHQQNLETTPLSLLKLVYLSHGWFLGIYKSPLIIETVEAWPYGPVIPIIYRRFQSYGGSPIDLIPADNAEKLTSKQRAVVDATLDAYKGFDSWALSAITHEEGTPWDQVSGRGWGVVIPNSLIQEHYADLYEA